MNAETLATLAAIKAERAARPAHGFIDAASDLPDMCHCGAAFYEGTHLSVMKRAHLESKATA